MQSEYRSQAIRFLAREKLIIPGLMAEVIFHSEILSWNCYSVYWNFDFVEHFLINNFCMEMSIMQGR